jgi:hypothetical protein
MQISESLSYRISTEFMEGFMGYIKISVYNLTQTRTYHGSVKSKVWNCSTTFMGRLLYRIITEPVEVLRDKRESQFVILRKLSIIAHECG